MNDNTVITLEKIDEKKFFKVVDMKLSAEQNRFVAPNVVSLAQAWLYGDCARPYAICKDGEVIGFIMLDWDEDERTIGIWRFMIATEHQNKGYGRKALEAAVALAKSKGKFDLMHLDYVPGNTVARGLYYSLGFRENGDTEDDEIIMTMKLTDKPGIGFLTADGDDADEIEELLKAADTEIPAKLISREGLEAELESGSISRFAVYGETVGILFEGSIIAMPGYKESLTGFIGQRKG